jgi:hypothetical protein
VIDAHPEPSGIRRHGLAAIAVAHWEQTERRVPSSLRSSRHEQAVVSLETERILRLVREMTEGNPILYKGAEVAAYYPDPMLRMARDVDVLFADPVQVQTDLVARGWVVKPAPGLHVDALKNTDVHQLAPLVWPGLALPLEVHRAPNWPRWASAPSFAEILEASQPSVTGIDGIRAPSTEHHTLMVLAHSWARQPFEQLSQLIDFALLRARCDDAELRRTAKAWGLARLLAVGDRTVDAKLEQRDTTGWLVRVFASGGGGGGGGGGGRQQINRYGASAFVTPLSSAARAAIGGVRRRFAVTFERDA